MASIATPRVTSDGRVDILIIRSPRESDWSGEDPVRAAEWELAPAVASDVVTAGCGFLDCHMVATGLQAKSQNCTDALCGFQQAPILDEGDVRIGTLRQRHEVFERRLIEEAALFLLAR